ncbi:MAG: RNase H family protein [Planctomycetota bacterium]|jgi:ribonuclease HI
MIKIWTDGSCDIHDPRRPGGWAFLLIFPMDSGSAVEIRNSGGSLGTTNNQMELMAILNAIKTLQSDFTLNGLERITVYSDSEWAVKCLKGEYNCRKRVIKQYLDEIKWTSGRLRIVYEHVRGHSGDKRNELVDKMAVKARQKIAAMPEDPFAEMLRKEGLLGTHVHVVGTPEGINEFLQEQIDEEKEEK